MPEPVILGTAADTEGLGGQTTVITTGTAHVAGQLIIVAVALTKIDPAVTDSAGNTYSEIARATTGTVMMAIFRSSGAIALDSGGTITVASGGFSGGSVCCAAMALAGYKNATDATGTNTGASGEPSVSIDPVATRTMQLAFAHQSSGLAGAGDEDPDWTSLGFTVLEATAPVLLTGAYRERTNSSADAWNPMTGLSVAWAAAAMSMEASAGPVTDAGSWIKLLVFQN